MAVTLHDRRLAETAARAIGRECRLTRRTGLIVYGCISGVLFGGEAVTWQDRGSLARMRHTVWLRDVERLEILGEPGTPRGVTSP